MFYIFYSEPASLAVFVFWRICRNIFVVSLYGHNCKFAYAQRATPAHHVLPCGSMLPVTHSVAESITVLRRVAVPIHLCPRIPCCKRWMLALFLVKTFVCTCDIRAFALLLCGLSRIACCNTFDFQALSQTACCSIRNSLCALFYVAYTQSRQYPRFSPIPFFCCTSCTCVFFQLRTASILPHTFANNSNLALCAHCAVSYKPSVSFAHNFCCKPNSLIFFRHPCCSRFSVRPAVHNPHLIRL